MKKEWSDYLVFVDESGDHLLSPSYKDHPIFVLAFCIFEKNYYASHVLKEFANLKMKYFPTNNIIFHEREIRKQTQPFTFLQSEAKRELFMNDLNSFISKIDFKIVATAIDKEKFQEKYKTPEHPYYLASQYCLERTDNFLSEQNTNNNSETTISFESRGKSEDKDLELEFRRLSQKQFNCKFDIEILPKLSNSTGLQIADLIARPIARHILKPEQENRAFDIIKTKFRNSDGIYKGYGLKVFP